MPKVSFRMASASRESVFGVQTNTARKIHRSDHTEGRLTTTPSGCCVRKGTPCGHSACIREPFPVEAAPRVPQHPPDECPIRGATTGTTHDGRLHASERAGRQLLRSCPGTSSESARPGCCSSTGAAVTCARANARSLLSWTKSSGTAGMTGSGVAEPTHAAAPRRYRGAAPVRLLVRLQTDPQQTR